MPRQHLYLLSRRGLQMLKSKQSAHLVLSNVSSAPVKQQRKGCSGVKMAADKVFELLQQETAEIQPGVIV